jgi:hypothetical protein
MDPSTKLSTKTVRGTVSSQEKARISKAIS